MKLHELKSQLESDASRRLQAQEVTIRRLNEEIARLQHDKGILQNRCFVLSHGTLCGYCDAVMKDTCEMVNKKNK